MSPCRARPVRQATTPNCWPSESTPPPLSSQPEELVHSERVRMTSPGRTIVDAAEVGTGSEHIIGAMVQALVQGC
jgi:hypothetical protein